MMHCMMASSSDDAAEARCHHAVRTTLRQMMSMPRCIDVMVLATLICITSKPHRAPFDVETKKDASPVTIADKQAEEAMREVLAQVRPSGWRMMQIATLCADA
jgi:chorismate synthase